MSLLSRAAPRTFRRPALALIAAALLATTGPTPATAAPWTTQPTEGAAAPTLTAELSTHAVEIGRKAAITGVLTPAAAGQRIVLQRWSNEGWHGVDEVATGVDGAYRLIVPRTATGVASYRVVKPATLRVPTLRASVGDLQVYRVRTYSVRADGVSQRELRSFAAQVATTYADPRGWLRANLRLRQVPGRGNFTVVLARSANLPRYSRVCSAKYSCRAGRNVVINAARWRHGSAPFTGPLGQYRQMVVNHETGHWLGSGHAFCKSGGPASVMQQQSKGMQGCAPNAWPLPTEIRSVATRIARAGPPIGADYR